MYRSPASMQCNVLDKAAKFLAMPASYLFFCYPKSAGFWSLDVSERVVREKTGSGLVLISMILHLEASSEPKHSKMPRKRREFPRSVEYGMASLVIFSLGLPFVFFVIHDGEMKFDHIKEQNNVKSF
ncbi:hypothetical protein BDE02_07G030400 [Populus trichocarpa]|uniref:Uncharacterized protein n=1 Tax=Populus trichocarpa TaxID=3694 RepID=A0A3N7F679_POPTR|nr:hypothetical protein BDE02_07G030400 [Populus trichocarpa]